MILGRFSTPPHPTDTGILGDFKKYFVDSRNHVYVRLRVQMVEAKPRIQSTSKLSMQLSTDLIEIPGLTRRSKVPQER